jgi:hypothetical protein
VIVRGRAERIRACRHACRSRGDRALGQRGALDFSSVTAAATSPSALP